MPKLTELPVASSLGDGDMVPIVQDSTTKTTTIAAIRAGAGGGGGTVVGYPPVRKMFSTLAGSSDDAKLDAFMNAYRGSTYKPTLELDELRAYTFSGQHELYTGFAWIGGGLRALDQARGSTPMGQKILIRQPSLRGMFTLPNGTVFGVHMSGLSFDSTGTGRLVEPNPSCVLWTSTFRDISWQNGPNLFGSDTVAQPIDACTFDGMWNVNNVQSCAFNLAGSDNRFVPTMMLYDSPTALMGPTGCLMKWTGHSKTTITGIYMTAEQHMGILFQGGGTGGQQMMRMHNVEIEGRNVNAPSYGCLIRVASDIIITQSWLSFAMSNPGSANGGSSANRGVVHITDGNVVLDGNYYRPANGVAQSVPFVFISGGSLTIRNIVGNDTSGNLFTPVVLAATGVTVRSDDTVTVTRF